ncbi:hypothetical protein [Thiomicrorhabdus indica]|uniref:hypothetical protein n=1 Tax=Thiomicrorhabdus indica TaxID=2267253 RepID=UPI002AA7C1BD|nr:hypothetical protein [Thiomicrorhabdus indica]
MKPNSSFTKITSALALALVATTSNAANWSSTSFVAHKGDSYELGPEERTVYTFEHVSGWDYGKNFFS